MTPAIDTGRANWLKHLAAIRDDMAGLAATLGDSEFGRRYAHEADTLAWAVAWIEQATRTLDAIEPGTPSCGSGHDALTVLGWRS